MRKVNLNLTMCSRVARNTCNVNKVHFHLMRSIQILIICQMVMPVLTETLKSVVEVKMGKFLEIEWVLWIDHHQRDFLNSSTRWSRSLHPWDSLFARKFQNLRWLMFQLIAYTVIRTQRSFNRHELKLWICESMQRQVWKPNWKPILKMRKYLSYQRVGVHMRPQLRDC